MNKITKYSLSFLLICFIAHPLWAQEKQPPFYNDIQQFKKQDKKDPPPKNAILFIGSSSFTKWKDVQDYFPDHQIINRGFGGSSMPDLLRYADEVIFPYGPKQIVLYIGDNDAASSDTISATTILNRFKKLYTLIRSELPKTEVSYVSIKPSPSREKFFPVMEKANWEIKQFLKEEKNADFIDIWHLMLDKNGKPRKELFGKDMLHMNDKGYLIWQKAIKPDLQ